MNEKGFTVRDFILVLIGLFFAIVILSLVIKGSLAGVKRTDPIKTSKSSSEIAYKEESYKELENKLKMAAYRYENDNYHGTLESKETWILKSSFLKEKGYLNGKLIDTKKKTCKGYVVFSKNGAKFTYTPFIKCGSNYKTEGYDSNNE